MVIKKFDFNNFDDNAELVKKLDSNYVIKISTFKDKNCGYVVAEYFKKGSLESYLKEKGKITEEEAINIFLDIAEAIKYLHERDIIHRDIRPRNIFITDEGKVKLGYFGFSKIVNSSLKSNYWSADSEKYMSDDAKNDKFTKESDIYAFSVTFNEIFYERVEEGSFKEYIDDWKDHIFEEESIDDIIEFLDGVKVQLK